MAMSVVETPRPCRNAADFPRTLSGYFACLFACVTFFITPHAIAQSAAYQDFVFAYRLLQRGEIKHATEAFDDFLGKFPDEARRGDALYYRAHLARRAGNHQFAVQLLTDAPKTTVVADHYVHLLMGQSLTDLKRYGEAVTALEAIQIDQLDPSVRASTLMLFGAAYRGAGNLPAAAARFDDAASIDSPVKSSALLNKAKAHVLMNQPDKALAALNTCVDDKRVGAEASRLAGDVAYNTGRLEDASMHYRRVLTHHQSSAHFPDAVVGLLWTQLTSRHYNALLATFVQYGATLPTADRAAAIYLAGSAQQGLGNHDKALQFFSGIRKDTETTNLADALLYKIAMSQFELGQLQQMDETVRLLALHHPRTNLQPDIQLLLTNADIRRGNKTSAAARLTAMIDGGPDHPFFADALLRRAQLYESIGEFDGAIADFGRYIDTPGRDAASTQQSHLRLIDLQSRVGDHEIAVTSADSLLASAPGGAAGGGGSALPPLVEQEAMYRRAAALIALGRTDEALSTLSALLAKHPANEFIAEARYFRGMLGMSGDAHVEQAVADLWFAAGTTVLDDARRIRALKVLAKHHVAREENDQTARALTEIESLGGLTELAGDDLLWLANDVLERGDPARTLHYTQPLTAGDAEVPIAQHVRALILSGRAMRDVGRPNDAIDAYRHVIALPTALATRARLELAQTYKSVKQYEEALGEYEGLISAPQSRIAAESLYDSAGIYRLLAAQFRRAGDQKAAVEASTRAHKNLKRLVVVHAFPDLSPLPERALVEMAELAHEAGEGEKVDGYYQELIDKFPDSAWAQYGKAMLAYRHGKRSESQALLKKIRARDDMGHSLEQLVIRWLEFIEKNP